MNDIVEKQRQRYIQDRRTDLINSLYRMGVYETPDGRNLEDVSLFTLEHVHVNEKCRMANIKQAQGELK
ncbi:Fur-regulated basic protein FbpA [Ornithinibacillus sp. L9]|uniref:Fur-regulated basic protein FbpA n=1 Tax=Ornithinibacillus caprae TaxID=2678566 RepID=A0A6N8FHR5_9BACI|nr:Fur-regulated basic protein FbpA [Ornithinibacillus caprae]MUK89130.1 Fur-regulated basic protein FbpA [Ornithinibacillus caprae]